MNIYWLDTAKCQDPVLVGGKAANLGRLAASYPVPPGFCLAATDTRGPVLSPSLYEGLRDAYAQLGERCRTPAPSVAVRSSAVDEDGALASFAGQHESYLNVVGAEAVAAAVARCVASARTERALHYRRLHGLGEETSVAVLVQQLVVADASAVVFSADPCSQNRDHVVINATWGLGECLVSGLVTPDMFVVEKASLCIIERRLAKKTLMTVTCPEGTKDVPVPRCMQRDASLSDAQILRLAAI